MALTEEVAMPWLVDAWAVQDGRIFVVGAASGSIDAQATVFLAVPTLEPVPVGRISTALRATRNGFQEGFRDDDGNEIEFQTLAQIREMARRAYLATGLGPAPPDSHRA